MGGTGYSAKTFQYISCGNGTELVYERPQNLGPFLSSNHASFESRISGDWMFVLEKGPWSPFAEISIRCLSGT